MALGGGLTQSRLMEERGGGGWGGRLAMDFTFVICFKRVGLELGVGCKQRIKKKSEQDVRMNCRNLEKGP